MPKSTDMPTRPSSPSSLSDDSAPPRTPISPSIPQVPPADGQPPTATTNATANAKRRASRRANTAERRATHNAVERQRRETLNSRFLDLAALLPNISQVRRPSKAAIVNSSIAHVNASKRHRMIAARELRSMKLEADSLRRELNEWRQRANLPLVEEPERSEGFAMVLCGELEPISAIQEEEDDASGDMADDDFVVQPSNNISRGALDSARSHPAVASQSFETPINPAMSPYERFTSQSQQADSWSEDKWLRQQQQQQIMHQPDREKWFQQMQQQQYQQHCQQLYPSTGSAPPSSLGHLIDRGDASDSSSIGSQPGSRDGSYTASPTNFSSSTLPNHGTAAITNYAATNYELASGRNDFGRVPRDFRPQDEYVPTSRRLGLHIDTELGQQQQQQPASYDMNGLNSMNGLNRGDMFPMM
ncbi:hypothetical protein FISHEDRAFT_58327 [Fistulina hepatica ATCC 64428]|nr:hypothetical protein FISHEDRAFT_58327 [Fistulina hepatica ATCC 64428]